MSVVIATKVFATEARVAIVRHCRVHPAASQAEIAVALDLPRSLVSDSVRLLLDAGVLSRTEDGAGRRPSRFTTDPQRVEDLLAALRRYSRGA